MKLSDSDIETMLGEAKTDVIPMDPHVIVALCEEVLAARKMRDGMIKMQVIPPYRDGHAPYYSEYQAVDLYNKARKGE